MLGVSARRPTPPAAPGGRARLRQGELIGLHWTGWMVRRPHGSRCYLKVQGNAGATSAPTEVVKPLCDTRWKHDWPGECSPGVSTIPVR